MKKHNHKEQEILQSIFHAIPTAIGHTKNQVLQFVNNRLCELVGYRSGELVGKSPSFLYPSEEEFNRVLKEKKRQIAEKGNGIVETQFLRKDGKVIDVLMRTVPLDSSDLSCGLTSTINDITREKEAKRALRQSEDQYRALVEFAPQGIQDCDLSGRITYCNPAHHKIFGYNPGELVGKYIWDLLATEEEKRALQEFLKTLVQNRLSPQPSITKNKRKDGKLIDVRVDWNYKYFSQKHAGFIAIITDISEQIKLEEKLWSYSHIVKASKDFISFVDKDYVYKAINDVYCSAFGKQEEDIVGHTVEEVLGKETFDTLIKEKIDKALQGEHVSYEAWFDFPADRYCLEVCYSPYIDNRGEITGVAVSGRDVTARKHAEMELQKANDNLELLVEERTIELKENIENLIKEVSAHKKTTTLLLKSQAELCAKTQDLQDVNATLKVMLKKRDQEKAELEESFQAKMLSKMTPYLDKLKKSGLKEQQKSLIQLLETSIFELNHTLTSRLTPKFFRFTPTETTVANLIMQGKTTKEIAGLLNVSHWTIDTHRENVRKKLGIKNKKQSLKNTLLSSF